MISLGGSSTYLQNQIISGFDSVAQGFTATATTTSATAFQTAQDSFSSFDTSEMTTLASMGSQQQISGAAEFSGPAAYLQSSGVQADDPVLRAFQDPSLASGADLSGISEILSKITADAEQKGIIIVSGSPTQLQQQASTKLEQAGVFAPPQVGGSTKLDQAGLITPPQIGGSTKLEQAGVFAPPQFEAPKLNLVGTLSTLQVDGFTGATNKGPTDPYAPALIPTEPHTPALYPSDPHAPSLYPTDPYAPTVIPSDPHAPSQFGAYDAITFSPQQTTALASMSKTVSDAASLFQNVNVSMLSRRIVG
jgi:hypothetical protein